MISDTITWNHRSSSVPFAGAGWRGPRFFLPLAFGVLVLAAGRQRWLEPPVNRWLKTYDLLFKVPISGSPSADGVRDTDEFFMRSIDRLVDDLLAERRLVCERLPEGRRDQWADVVKATVLRLPALAERLF